jgi:drug/metabolite transporter (DMT)-like permease
MADQEAKTMIKRPAAPPILVLAFGILAVSTASVFIRNAQQYAPSLVIAAYRLTLATVILSPLALTRHRSELGSLKRNDRILALLSGIFLALHFATWISSLEYTSVASSVVLVSTTPLWVALLAPITLKEKITRSILIGMFLALIGSLVVILSDSCIWNGASLACPSLSGLLGGEAFIGNILALCGAWMAAGYVIIGRRMRSNLSLVGYVFIVYGIAALVLVFIMLSAGEQPFGYPPEAYLWFLLLALIPQLLGHSSFNWALGYLPAAYVSISMLGEPIGSTILAYIFLDEKPTLLKIFGAILILFGIFIASRSQKQ